jgi:hypothetical protein
MVSNMVYSEMAPNFVFFNKRVLIQVYSEKVSVADASASFLSIADRLTAGYKANKAELWLATASLRACGFMCI